MDWLNRRLDLMKRYTFASLAAQLDQDFLHVIETRPETFLHVQEAVSDARHNVAVTIPDKWPTNYPADYPNTGHVIGKYVEGHKTFLETRLNSDDCLHRKFVDTVRNWSWNPGSEVLIPQNGFRWYLNEDKVVECWRKSPPFHTFRYSVGAYKLGFRFNPPGGHDGCLKMEHEFFTHRYWLWIVWDGCNKILRGKSYPPSWKFKKAPRAVLSQFGIYGGSG